MGLVSRPTPNPPTRVANRAYVLGERVQGIYWTYSGEGGMVEAMVMIGVRLLGGVGVLLSRMMGVANSEMSFASLLTPALAKSSIGIGCRGMGAKIRGGSCSSGMPSGSLVGVVVTVEGGAWGASICCSGL